MRYAAGSCSVTGCNRPVRYLGFCYGHYQRVQDHGDPFAHVPLGTHRLRPDRAIHGPWVCICETSRPGDPDNLKACVTCGYPCVAWMHPNVRDATFADFPWYRDQPIDPVGPPPRWAENRQAERRAS